MVESPGSLQELVVEFIASHVKEVCTSRFSLNDFTNRLYFRDSNAFCHQKVANLLLMTLDRKGLLDDLNMTLFDPVVLRLSQVTLHHADNVTCKGLKILRSHQIQSVEVKNLTKVSVDELISCFGEWTMNNIQALSVSGSSFTSDIAKANSKGSVLSTKLYVGLSKLKNLHILNVSGTELASHALLNVCIDLQMLSSLDISNCTKLESVECLRIRKNTLRSLNMYNLKVLRMEETKRVLLELRKLIHLDISENVSNQDPIDRLMETCPIVPSLLSTREFGPNLCSLDISGQDQTKLEDLYFFLKHHPKIEFLGLMLTSLCLDTVFLDGYNVTVTGVARADQLVEALRRYPKRIEYVPKILYKIFMLTTHFESPRPDVIKLILPVMNTHSTQSSIQLAGTACLYNLTKGQMGEQIHPHILRDVVHTTLTAMNNFPNHSQLQKNGLLTLCCDRILHEVSFDKYRCARLVLDCLLTFNDPSTDRMAVAICSILAAKISTTQTALLGAKSVYMRKLLSLVQTRMEERAVDITLKFTLSALWNLTDESPATCEVFLAEKGLHLFLQLLNVFARDAAVETKVLGLLNNIAEVSPLRGALINQHFVAQLKTLLWSPNVDVSYFAAGIVAHLVCASEDSWNEPGISKEDLLEELGKVVISWEQPKEEMVAYRSFQPFIPLLTALNMHQVQLWAVWALHHVTTKNSKRYCHMLVREGVDDVLRKLVALPHSNTCVRELAEKVVDVLQENGYTKEL
ncbi:protein zyg-11 homolog B [Cherax quadricarinatus]|nr:protein zyg-11 homolog B-like [Cherax quadricarinatus]XP_053655724.1 protein zyg-11 homolog B-like [Cherax quadricarinatus]XP_053655725.1 protein zyg-11 homolog B-like [Cherax quadricarinatus]